MVLVTVVIGVVMMQADASLDDEAAENEIKLMQDVVGTARSMRCLDASILHYMYVYVHGGSSSPASLHVCVCAWRELVAYDTPGVRG